MTAILLLLQVLCTSVEPNIAYSTQESINTIIENDPRRIIVMGDTHGSWDNFKQIALNLNLINDEYQWIANDTIFVQIGDLIHRREGNVEIVSKLFEYQEHALNYNSKVCLIMGNHDYEQIKWNPQNVYAFIQIGAWYMPDYQRFYELKLHQKLRELKLIYKINGFIFVHAGIEKKHLDAAGTTDINQINKFMSQYFADLTFNNQNNAQFTKERKVASAVWLQWLHNHKQKGIEYCDKVNQVLDILHSHTMIVGHYFPSSEKKIFNDCDGSIIFTDIGMWYNYLDVLIIEDNALYTLSGTVLNPSFKYKNMLDIDKTKQEL